MLPRHLTSHRALGSGVHIYSYSKPRPCGLLRLLLLRAARAARCAALHSMASC